MGTPSHPNRTVRVKDLNRFRQKLAEAGDTAYHKPQGGIPKSDLDSSVQQSLDNGDNAAQAVTGKADKSATVSNVAYDTSSKKIRKTINGSTTDVVSAADIVTDGGGIKSNPVMTGATSGAAGTKGLVPAPAAGDNTKFLRGDGTWSDKLPRAEFVGTTLVFHTGAVYSGTTLVIG